MGNLTLQIRGVHAYSGPLTPTFFITLQEGLNVGDVVCCTVKKVTSYGAFVEVQGVPALIHISELSWNRIVDPTTVVAVGQELEAKVCRLDQFMQRINLSLKQMQVRLRYIHTIAYELMYTVHFFIQIERGL
jgi:translation initiation factor 2 alpha subunit (eIF-2alpha)